ncbi:hypothetical protein ABZ746_29595 [Streptomyces sp. NPDC020096]
MLSVPDTARDALTDARDAYDAACEALAWSAAFTVLGAWWWPAALGGVALWLASWQSLRRAVRVLCRTAEAVFAMHHTHRPTLP